MFWSTRPRPPSPLKCGGVTLNQACVRVSAAWQEQTKHEADAACLRAGATTSILVDRLGGLNLSPGEATERLSEALKLELKQVQGVGSLSLP